MDDEEEDMSRPISQLWGTTFREVKYEERATQIAAGQALAAVTATAAAAAATAATVSTSQSHTNNNSIDALPCAFHRQQPRIPFHGNAGLRSHFPAQFEPMEDRGERQIEEEEEEEEEEAQQQQQQQQQGRGEGNDRLAELPQEQAGLSVEAQIGRKLREIGDKFHQDHVELFLRHHRPILPLWMRLTNALFGFFFPNEALFRRLRGEQR
ncbi:unnamed protein product [Ophioblennius macclurei]